ncbi:MAG: hypothetical protein J6Y39_02715 [Bacteroidaceae bacterium]|nr:hypothetical protein [Bacteroidaceae bacterium]
MKKSGASRGLGWRQSRISLAPVENQSRAGWGLGRKEKRETSEQREQSDACIDFAKSRVRKTDRSNEKRERSERRDLRRLN